jgi:hypothetical protein
MNAVVELKPQAGALATTQGSGRMAVADLIQHVAVVQEVIRAVMKQDVHYGIIPGTDKPTLYKAGAEVLCMVFRIASSYAVEDLSTAEVTRYRVTCTGTHQTTGVVLGAGMGEASSGEEKYKWRKAYEPEFNETPANLRRKKMGYNKSKKEHYAIFQVRTEPADLANTVLKMANKRAQMAMVLNVTAASDCFAQDLEDMDEALRDHLTRHGEAAAPAQAEQPAGPAVWPDDVFAKKLPTFLAAIAKGKSADEIIAWAETKGALTEAQKAQIRGPAAPAQDAQPPITYAAVADALTKAADREALYLAGDLIKSVADEKQRAELTAMFEQRDQQLPE